MKKILLATTMMFGAAGMAAAEVAVSGSGRLGVVYDGNTTGVDTSKAKFTSRVRVSFAGTGETDNGLSFGFSVRADQSGQGNTANNDSTIYIGGSFGKITFGDNDSAANAIVGNVDAKSLTGIGDVNELGYLGQTDTSVLYTHTIGAVSFALSMGQLGTQASSEKAAGTVTCTVAGAPAAATCTVTGATPTAKADAANEDAMSVALKYTMGDYYFAVGYETAKEGDAAKDVKQTTVGVGGKVGPVDLKLVAMDKDTNTDTHFAASATYTTGGTAVTGFFADKGTTDAYGLGASYDLGGKATLIGGVQKVKGKQAMADLGVSFSF